MKDMTLNRYRVIFDKFKILSHLLLNYLNLRNRGDLNPDLTPKIHRKRCVHHLHFGSIPPRASRMTVKK